MMIYCEYNKFVFRLLLHPDNDVLIIIDYYLILYRIFILSRNIILQKIKCASEIVEQVEQVEKGESISLPLTRLRSSLAFCSGRSLSLAERLASLRERSLLYTTNYRRFMPASCPDSRITGQPIIFNYLSRARTVHNFLALHFRLGPVETPKSKVALADSSFRVDHDN